MLYQQCFPFICVSFKLDSSENVNNCPATDKPGVINIPSTTSEEGFILSQLQNPIWNLLPRTLPSAKCHRLVFLETNSNTKSCTKKVYRWTVLGTMPVQEHEKQAWEWGDRIGPHSPLRPQLTLWEGLKLKWLFKDVTEPRPLYTFGPAVGCRILSEKDVTLSKTVPFGQGQIGQEKFPERITTIHLMSK